MKFRLIWFNCHRWGFLQVSGALSVVGTLVIITHWTTEHLLRHQQRAPRRITTHYNTGSVDGNIGKNTHHIRAWVSETVRFYESVKVNNPRMENGRSPSAMLVLWNVTEPCTCRTVECGVVGRAYTPPPRYCTGTTAPPYRRARSKWTLISHNKKHTVIVEMAAYRRGAG